MSQIPKDLKYLSTHEWVRIEADGTAFVGITDHAQEALGDIVFIEPPELDSELSAGEEAGVVESVKAASDIYAPLSGKVVAINEELEGAPESVNNDPYGDGWIYQVKVADSDEVTNLLTDEDYTDQLESE